MERGQKDSRSGEKVTRIVFRKEIELYSTASTLMISTAGFVFSSEASKVLNSVYLTNNSRTFPMTTEQGAVGGGLIFPQFLGGSECVSACGNSGCVFNASLLGGMGIGLLSGSGHIQYRGITPGSSEEMRTRSSPLALCLCDG